MRPFPGRMHERLTNKQRIFNYRLSRARCVSENAFGILAIRWQVLNSPLVCSLEKAEDIIKALVCLHNMLMDNEAGDYVNRTIRGRARGWQYSSRSLENSDRKSFPKTWQSRS